MPALRASISCSAQGQWLLEEPARTIKVCEATLAWVFPAPSVAVTKNV
jgi:hypothetical protein